MPLDAKELSRAVTFLARGDWRAAHAIVQRDEESPLACWAHGIVHILEGDLPNARYWYGMAGRAFPTRASADDEVIALKKKIGL